MAHGKKVVGVNKSAIAREFLGMHPTLKPKELAELIKRDRNINVGTALISGVKGYEIAKQRKLAKTSAKGVKGPRGRRKMHAVKYEADTVVALFKVVDRLGGISEVRKLFDRIEE